jgi:dihydrodipicolinate reductase
MRKDDPGVGTLGLNIRMGDETISVAQKARDHNLVGFTDQTEPFGEAPPNESPQEKVLRGK